MKDLKIAGIKISQNANGLYNLNDLHKASGGDPNKRPGDFLKIERTKRLVNALKANGSTAPLDSSATEVFRTARNDHRRPLRHFRRKAYLSSLRNLSIRRDGDSRSECVFREYRAKTFISSRSNGG